MTWHGMVRHTFSKNSSLCRCLHWDYNTCVPNRVSTFQLNLRSLSLSLLCAPNLIKNTAEKQQTPKTISAYFNFAFYNFMLILALYLRERSWLGTTAKPMQIHFDGGPNRAGDSQKPTKFEYKGIYLVSYIRYFMLTEIDAAPKNCGSRRIVAKLKLWQVVIIMTDIAIAFAIRQPKFKLSKVFLLHNSSCHRFSVCSFVRNAPHAAPTTPSLRAGTGSLAYSFIPLDNDQW